MNIVTGIDIVNIERFQKVLKKSGEPFLKRVFLEAECIDGQSEHLAGVFAAKEAVKKAFDIAEVDVWQKIEVRKRLSGKPEIILRLDLAIEVISSDVSIAHDGGNAVAIFVALVG